MKAKQFFFPGTHPAGVEPPREVVNVDDQLIQQLKAYRRTGSSIAPISERFPRGSSIPSRLSGEPWERRWFLFASGEPSIRPR